MFSLEMPGEGPTYELVKDGDSSHLINVSGDRIEIQQGGRQGSVNAIINDDDFVIRGWAASPTRGEIAIEVAVFDGSTFIATVPPTLSRSDVANHFSDDRLLRSGFRLIVQRKGLNWDAVRIYGIYRDGTATELRKSQRRD